MKNKELNNISQSSKDLHGQRRILNNVFTSWAAQVVQIVSGFIVPRLIDTNLGQQELGIWDFAWTIVAYFSLIQAGVTSSINRYVAMFRAKDDIQGVNRSVSSVTVILLVMGTIITVLSLGSFWFTPQFFGLKLGDYLSVAQWVIFFIGISLAVEVALSAFGGILTGCHRWDLHNAIYAGAYVLTFLGMLYVLLHGKGLIELAFVYLIGQSCGWFARWILAYRVCPGLHINLKFFCAHTAKEMLGFGGKTFIPRIGELLVNQTVNILIVGHLGPAALALFSRPRALVLHLKTFMSKYSFVLVPTASSINGLNEKILIQKFLIDALRYSGYICLPTMLFLIIMGGNLVELWMGTKYRDESLVIALTIGHIAYIAYLPLFYILSGLNIHGRPGMANFLASCLTILLTYIALNYLHWGLIGAAVAIGIPLTIANGIYMPLFACKQLQIPVFQFYLQTWKGPVLCCIPFAFGLLIGRLYYVESPAKSVILGFCFGSIPLLLCYWKWALTEQLRGKLIDILRRGRK